MSGMVKASVCKCIYISLRHHIISKNIEYKVAKLHFNKKCTEYMYNINMYFNTRQKFVLISFK